MKRFDNDLLKNTNLIEVEESLEVKEETFHLLGIIVHIGDTMADGHYVYCYKNMHG